MINTLETCREKRIQRDNEFHHPWPIDRNDYNYIVSPFEVMNETMSACESFPQVALNPQQLSKSTRGDGQHREIM